MPSVFEIDMNSQNMQDFLGHATAQVVKHWLVTTEAGFSPR
jgi:hypothetical protein